MSQAWPTATADGVWIRESYNQSDEWQYDFNLTRWGIRTTKSVTAYMDAEKVDSQSAVALCTSVLPDIYITAATSITDSISGQATWRVDTVGVQDYVNGKNRITCTWVTIPVSFNPVT